jgi:transcriptional regulator with XRE-family HTH domain
VPSGQQLKTFRNGRNITVREVEHASRRIADIKGDKRFCISNGWLAQLENGASESSIHKLFSLSVIYRVSFLDLLRLYNVDLDEKEKYERVADPYLTQLVADKTNGERQLYSNQHVETCLLTDLQTEAPVNGNHDGHIIHAQLGLTDFTMFPMIRPGAFLRIDSRQNKVTAGVWHNEYERPIFFIELRDAYAFGWCELHGNQLLIVPHHSSPAGIRQFTYPRDAEIVGRVVSYHTGCVDPEPQLVKPSPRRRWQLQSFRGKRSCLE